MPRKRPLSAFQQQFVCEAVALNLAILDGLVLRKLFNHSSEKRTHVRSQALSFID